MIGRCPIMTPKCGALGPTELEIETFNWHPPKRVPKSCNFIEICQCSTWSWIWTGEHDGLEGDRVSKLASRAAAHWSMIRSTWTVKHLKVQPPKGGVCFDIPFGLVVNLIERNGCEWSKCDWPVQRSSDRSTLWCNLSGNKTKDSFSPFVTCHSNRKHPSNLLPLISPLDLGVSGNYDLIDIASSAAL